VPSAGVTLRCLAPQVTRLGPGDFFGETGLLEGRTERNTTVRCATPVELLAVDKVMFLLLTKEQVPPDPSPYPSP